MIRGFKVKKQKYSQDKSVLAHVCGCKQLSRCLDGSPGSLLRCQLPPAPPSTHLNPLAKLVWLHSATTPGAAILDEHVTIAGNEVISK